MKKLISSVLSVCILLSMVLGTNVAYANEPELTSESTTFKGTGLADETSLLKEVGLIKDDASVEPDVDEESSEEDLKQKFSQLTEKNIENATREFDGETNTNYQELYDEYSNIDLENREIELDETEASNYAISYYSGTSIPTYTSVTGWSLRDSYTSDGYVFYSYYYYLDDHFDYINYLIDYYGWSYYDDTEASDGSYATIYLVKGYDMIAIIANFKYNETVIMFEAPTTVNPTSVSLDISSRTMIVGNQYTLEATVYPSNASNKSVTWSSSNSSVASVSSSGVVTAKAAGSATITAKTSNGKTATCSITVKNLVLAYYPNTKIPTFTCITGKSVYQSMEDDGTTMYFYTLDIESHTDYEAYLVNKDGWTILDEELASDNSYFSALYGKGDVTMLVMANFESGLTGIAFDTPVTTVPVTGVSLNKTSATMTVGNTMTLTATVSPSTATNKNVTWTSSNTSVATVSTSGVVTAKAAGSATITVKTADGNKTATCSITVTNPTVAVTGVSLNKSSANMTVGDTMTLTATVSPSNATNKSVTWSSSNTSIATVSSSGVVTAKAAGSATITVKTADGNKSATCAITVTNATIAVTGISLNKTSTTLFVGDTETLSATIAPEDATNKSVTWSSSNTSVATVSSNGVVTAKAEGTTTITVKTADGNKTATCSITVTNPTVAVTGVSLNKSSANMTVGDTMTLTATVSPSNATNKSVTWSSSNTSIATVSSSGVVTAKAAGSATITVKTADGNKSATCAITVTNATIAVTGISLNKTSTTLFVGDTETLSATIAPEDATNKSVTWSSSNTSVATVSSNGVVTAKAEGTTTITVKTADGNKTATCTVTVKPITPTIEVESAFGQAGNVVDVTIKMAHNPGVALVGFNVNYNSDVMTLKSATLGDIFTGELECNINAVPFVFNVYSGSSNKTASGDLVTLQFEIKESCPVGDYDITLSNIETLNIDENAVNFDCTNGKITVRDSIPGDVNGDGKVTRNDLLRLAKHFSGFTVEIDEVAADVTADGKVTRNDLLRLAKYFSGFDVALGK